MKTLTYLLFIPVLMTGCLFELDDDTTTTPCSGAHYNSRSSTTPPNDVAEQYRVGSTVEQTRRGNGPYSLGLPGTWIITQANTIVRVVRYDYCAGQAVLNLTHIEDGIPPFIAMILPNGQNVEVTATDPIVDDSTNVTVYFVPATNAFIAANSAVTIVRGYPLNWQRIQ
ncbi:MAG: hypothetical protein LBT84_07115 [Spirochaetia bacterium]|jgi:hypothetical protein|nr:hypothetical protein [Spirochaetia bacterium]